MHTWCPWLMSSGTTTEPTQPVAPVTKTFMKMDVARNVSREAKTGDMSPTESHPLPVTRRGYISDVLCRATRQRPSEWPPPASTCPSSGARMHSDVLPRSHGLQRRDTFASSRELSLNHPHSQPPAASGLSAPQTSTKRKGRDGNAFKAASQQSQRAFSRAVSEFSGARASTHCRPRKLVDSSISSSLLKTSLACAV